MRDKVKTAITVIALIYGTVGALVGYSGMVYGARALSEMTSLRNRLADVETRLLAIEYPDP